MTTKASERVRPSAISKRTRINALSLGFCVLLSGLAPVVTGRAAPKVTVKASEKLQGYTKVYITPIKSDVDKLSPRILARLQKAGFEAEEVNPQKLPFTSQGSGFVLTPEGHVLTCSHVVGNEPQATLWIEGTRYLGRVLTLDTNLDAALVQVQGNHPAFSFLSLAKDTNYHLGQEVYTMGFPVADLLGKSPRLNKGVINSTSGLGDVPWKVQISAEVQPGNSGGPLLSPQGEVLGMVDSTVNPFRFLLQTGGDLPQNVNFAIKNYPLKKFLAISGLSLPATPSLAINTNFEEMTKSLVLIRGGMVEEKRLQEKALIYRCPYVYGQNKHLIRVRLQFIDLRSLKLVLEADLTQESFASADKILDVMFAEVCEKFFPDHPNPFRPAKMKN